jgi:hypothetical protein
MKRWLMAAAILTLAISLLVFLEALSPTPPIRFGVPGQWTWRYDHSPFADRFWICLAGAVLLGGLCYWTRMREYELVSVRLPMFLAAVVLLIFWLQASFANLSRSGFGQGVFWMGTPKANVDFAEACKVTELSELLRAAHEPNRPFRIHLSTHPPGPILFYLLQKRLWELFPAATPRFVALAETALPYAGDARKILEETVLSRSLNEFELATLYSSILLLWLAVALGAIPLYFWIADLFGPSTAVMALALYGLIPSLLIFNPMTDQLYPPLAIALWAMYHLGLARRDAAQLVFAGVLTWLALQFTLAFAVVIVAIGAFVGLEIWIERRPWEVLKLLAWSAAAFILLILIGLAVHYNSILIWKLCSVNNALFNTKRSYLPWAGYNPIDFLLFLGLPISVFFFRGLFAACRDRNLEAPTRFTLVFAGTIVLLNFSGTNRGEVARLWMFLMPLATAIAAHQMRDREKEKDWTFLTCFGLLFVQSVLFKLSFDMLLPAVE